MPGEGMQAPLSVRGGRAAARQRSRHRRRRAAARELETGRHVPVLLRAESATAAARALHAADTATAGSPPTAASSRCALLRSTSLAFGLLTVILTFAAVWRLSRDARIALLAGALVAFNPQFLFSSGCFSNDPRPRRSARAALWIVVARAPGDAAGRRAPPLSSRRGR